jgi:hypothetical protein
MKKLLLRALALAGLLALSVAVPGCYPYEETDTYGYSPVGVSVSVYGGYYSPGWGSCCYGANVGVPRQLPAYY